MKYMTLNELREAFLKFFEQNNHYIENSYYLVPKEDKSLLLINSGMAPLKGYFTGAKIPPGNKLATCQKCIRTGDIERVGKTARHATFFEMLGNFSFGDYFKEVSLKLGWEFVTKVLEIPEEKLWVTVYLDDDEAYDIWKDVIGVPEHKIIRLGKKDNFWEIGTGPCGPCSEIYIDRGEKYSCGDPNHLPGCDCDQYVEFWNHVFTQYNRTEDGKYIELEKKNIDTGMGLERLASIMQETDTIYDIDTNKSIINKVEEISNKKYTENNKVDVSIRIITDHIKAVTFMISDGILPNNEGRGYVLRRLLRRAARHGKLIGIDTLFLNKLVDKVIENYGLAYTNLVEKREYINKVVSVEESKFLQTIDQGMNILESYISEAIKEKVDILEAQKAFKLYDTYGFPIDLTEEILEEHNMKVDIDGFNQQMKLQKERARNARNNQDELGWENQDESEFDYLGETIFIGNDTLKYTAKPLQFDSKDNKINIAFELTPFYAESGGQIGDKGIVQNESTLIEIHGVTKNHNKTFIHHGTLIRGELNLTDTYDLIVDKSNRFSIMRNHTATHLLHKALRNVLGEHVTQAGSLVDEQKLRFDFTHFEGISRSDLEKVEKIVNQEILNASAVEISFKTLDEAKKDGAMALFDEKYGNNVRVVKINDFSTELCGGTHTNNTGQIGVFKIISENGIAAGVRRIEALTGENALNYISNLEKNLNVISSLVKSNINEIEEKVTNLLKENKDLSKEIDKLKTKLASTNISDILNNSFKYNNVEVFFSILENLDNNTLKDLADKLKDKNDNSQVILLNKIEDKISILAMSTEGAIRDGLNSGNIVKNLSKYLNGSGGGRPNLAQGAGKDISKLNELGINFKYLFKEFI